MQKNLMGALLLLSVVGHASTNSLPASPPSAPLPASVDCHFTFNPTQLQDTTIVQKWAEQAALQSFKFDYANINEQLNNLKECYTDQGWQSFQDALHKSGNLNTIINQKLSVSSVLDNPVTLTLMKDNQWKASIPLQVTYKNERGSIVQNLDVQLIFMKKNPTKLGIAQLIAELRPATDKKP